jgi:hypothetical protein
MRWAVSTMMRLVRITLTAVLLVVSAVATAVSVAALPFYDFHTNGWKLITFTVGLWALFGAAFVLLRRIPAKAAIALIIAGSVAIGGAAMAGPPNTSTDSARYAWDGIVQNAGISPYAYVPTSPHLASLRPEWLFPTPSVDAAGVATCPGSRIQTSHEPGTTTVVCTALNRGKSHTIYPPSSELLFAGIRFVVGPDAEYWPMQLVGLLLSLGILAMLMVALRRRGMDVRWAALWGWCPLVATEAITNSHVDTLGALLLLAATLLVASGRRWLGGIALGAAIAAKLIPVIGAPALLRRQPWKIIVASIATFLVLYVPYILASGPKVLGYLPGYLNEEGFDDGSRFALISVFVHGKAATVVAAILLVALAVLVWRKTNPSTPWLGQLVMIGATLLIVSPRYPWYALLLVPMIALSGRWEWMAVPLALTARALVPHLEVQRIAELIAVVVIVAVSLQRSGPGVLGRVRRELRHPFRASTPAPTAPTA